MQHAFNFRGIWLTSDEEFRDNGYYALLGRGWKMLLRNIAHFTSVTELVDCVRDWDADCIFYACPPPDDEEQFTVLRQFKGDLRFIWCFSNNVEYFTRWKTRSVWKQFDHAFVNSKAVQMELCLKQVAAHFLPGPAKKFYGPDVFPTNDLTVFVPKILDDHAYGGKERMYSELLQELVRKHTMTVHLYGPPALLGRFPQFYQDECPENIGLVAARARMVLWFTGIESFGYIAPEQLDLLWANHALVTDFPLNCSTIPHNALFRLMADQDRVKQLERFRIYNADRGSAWVQAVAAPEIWADEVTLAVAPFISQKHFSD